MSTPDNYTPAKTRTLVFILLALAVAVFGGLFVGNSFGTYKIGPNVGDFPPYEYSEPAVFAQGASTAPTVADPAPTTESECVEYQKNGDCVQAPVVVGTPASEASKTRDGHMSGVPKATQTSEPVRTLPPVVQTPEVTPEASVVTSEVPITQVTPEVPAEEPLVCGEGEVLDPEVGCVAVQLPEEIIGREVEGPNGELCVVIDAEGNLDCAPREEVIVE